MSKPNDIEKTYRVLQGLAGAALFDVGSDTNCEKSSRQEADLKDVDWIEVLNEARYQQIVSLTFPIVAGLAESDDPSLSIPEYVLEDWRSKRDSDLGNNIRNVSCHYSVHEILIEAEIPYVIIKGLASASYYPDPMSRTYGDIDFFVKKEDADRADELFSSRGFEFTFEHDKHKVYKRSGFVYEMHTDIVGRPSEATRVVFDGFFEDIVEKATEYRSKDGTCMIPSPAHHAVILLLHMVEHMRYDGIGFRHLCDWAAFVGRMPDSFFEEEMQAKLKEMGIWRFAVIMTDLCTEYLGLRQCSWAGITGSDHLKKIMDDVISSGHFGIKSSGKETTARRHAAHGVSRGERGFALVMLNMLTDSAKAAFPITERKPLLLPAACIYVGVRHIFRIGKGTRSISGTSQMMTDAKDRREIFDRWHLFEPED